MTVLEAYRKVLRGYENITTYATWKQVKEQHVSIGICNYLMEVIIFDNALYAKCSEILHNEMHAQNITNTFICNIPKTYMSYWTKGMTPEIHEETIQPRIDFLKTIISKLENSCI